MAVKAGAAVVAAGAVRAAEAKPKAAVMAPTSGTVTTSPTQFQEDSGNTTGTTVAAGLLAVVTWGTAAVLCYYSLLS